MSQEAVTKIFAGENAVPIIANEQNKENKAYLLLIEEPALAKSVRSIFLLMRTQLKVL